MKLIAYLKQLPEDGREQFARDCETSVGHLRNVAYGYRPCAAELAVLIEVRSQRKVTFPVEFNRAAQAILSRPR